MKYALILLFLPLLPFFAYTQKDSTYHAIQLPGVEIKQMSVSKSVSISLNNAASLTQNTLVQIKTYGTAALATLSIRGLGSQHCAIIWNGFNIQNSMHGTTDISLSGLHSTTQDFSIDYGSSCARDGSGTVAGSFVIKRKPITKEGIQLSIANALGSFGYREQSLYMGYKNRKGYLQVDYNNEYAKNEFLYDENGNPSGKKLRLKNALSNIHQFNLNGSAAFSHHCSLSGAINYAEAYRQIPNTEFQSQQSAFQKDKQIKSYLGFQFDKKYTAIHASLGYFYDQLDYSDPLSNLISGSHIHKVIAQIKVSQTFHRRHQISFVAENIYAKATALSYIKGFGQQHVFALSGMYTFRNKKNNLLTLLSLRQQINNKKISPFIFDVSLTYEPVKPISLFIKGARIFKLPTLNDLYWNPGGNPNLLPEKGWNAELMLKLNYKKDQFTIENSLSNFYYLINNWIIWLPTDQGYWAPQNVKKVFSRGLQEEISISYTKQKLSVAFNAGYQFNLSTQIAAANPNDATNKKQLIYEPLHKVYGNISLSYNRFTISYSHQYTGKRFTTSDNSNYLNAFHTGNLLLSKTFISQQFEFIINAGVENIFNTKYYMVESRPMPGRNYKIGIIFKCHNSLKK